MQCHINGVALRERNKLDLIQIILIVDIIILKVERKKKKKKIVLYKQTSPIRSASAPPPRKIKTHVFIHVRAAFLHE